MYGSRLDFVLLDDIVEDYQPETEQERIISWLLGRVQSRLPADGKVTLLLATRVHEQDLYSHFLDDSNEWTSSWAKLQLPALNEANDSYWPEMWPVEELERRRESMRSRDWALIYQQEALGHPDAKNHLDVLEASKDPERMVGHIPRDSPSSSGWTLRPKAPAPWLSWRSTGSRSAATSSTASPSTDLDNARRSSPRSSTRSDGTGRSGRWSRRTSPSSARTPTSSGSCICSNARWSDSIQAEAASATRTKASSAQPGASPKASSAPRRSRVRDEHAPVHRRARALESWPQGNRTGSWLCGSRTHAPRSWACSVKACRPEPLRSGWVTKRQVPGWVEQTLQRRASVDQDPDGKLGVHRDDRRSATAVSSRRLRWFVSRFVSPRIPAGAGGYVTDGIDTALYDYTDDDEPDTESMTDAEFSAYLDRNYPGRNEPAPPHSTASALLASAQATVPTSTQTH